LLATAKLHFVFIYQKIAG